MEHASSIGRACTSIVGAVITNIVLLFRQSCMHCAYKIVWIPCLLLSISPAHVSHNQCGLVRATCRKLALLEPLCSMSACKASFCLGLARRLFAPAVTACFCFVCPNTCKNVHCRPNAVW